jgi:flagellar protein FliJ
MAKVKASRKFKYNLQTVLKVREIKEKKEQEKFAEKKRSYVKEKTKEEQLKEEQKNRNDELKNMIGGGSIKDFASVLRRKDHLGILKEDVDKQIDRVIEASRILEDQRVNLIEAMKKKKIMEKDKENKLEQYKDVMLKIEMKFLDELATQRFVHEKLNREEG